MKPPGLITVIVAVTFTTLIATTLGEERAAPSTPKVTVGVFDSRAIVIAYANSEMFQNSMKETKEQYRAAKAAGNEETTQAIEARTKAKQEEFHRQAFAATPVTDLLELIKDEIPGIADRAGVDLIVSKWQIVHQVEGAEVVDVTMALIDPFKPNEKALKSIADIKGKMPVSLAELEGRED